MASVGLPGTGARARLGTGLLRGLACHVEWECAEADGAAAVAAVVATSRQ